MSLQQGSAQSSTSSSQVSEVESTLQRINQHPGVLGLIITQNDCSSSRVLSTSDDSPVVLNKDAYAQGYTGLAAQARSAIRDLDPMVCIVIFFSQQHLTSSLFKLFSLRMT